MRKIKKLWILFIPFAVITSKTYAEHINFNSEWIWVDGNEQLSTDKVTLNQHGSVIVGNYISKCGPVTIAGAAQKNEIGLNLNIEKNKNNCSTWVQLTATCSNDDCSTIKGKWYDSNHLMGNLTWIKENKKFYISSPEPGSKFFIDAQLYMPSLKFLATNAYPPAPLKWSLKVDFHWRRGKTSATLPAIITNTNDYIPDINSWGIIGGNLATTAIYNPSHKSSKTAIGNYKIYGTNPGKALIKQEISDPLLAKIACVESVYRQFDAASESGQGLPLIGKNSDGEKVGGVGIMQVRHEQIIPKTVWNWRDNIKDGLQILNEKRYYAKRFYINERIRLNAERKKLGLASCPKNIPTPLSPDQLVRDSIRRYNYGVEYRWEPRDAKDCAGQWVISPSCVRHPMYGCDKDYVNKVLRCTI